MRPNVGPKLVCFCLLLLAAVQVGLARGLDRDLPGARDPAGVERFSESVIIGYRVEDGQSTRMPLGPWVAGRSKGDWKKSLEVAGRRTRILYLIPRTVGSREVMKHYREVLGRAGYEMLYACVGEDECGTSVAHFYAEEAQGKRLTDSYLLKRAFSGDSAKDPWILVGERRSGGAEAHLFVFGAYQDNYADSGAGERVAVFVEGVEAARSTAKPTGDVIDAQELARSMAEEGHAVLYAIGFESERSTTLLPDSGPQLEAMARMLSESPDLSVYIVGHTDNQGNLDGNLDLSRRRATEVVQTLILNYGIPGERLTPRGVASLAPVATNATPEGRARNRRIELVPR
ncbi:OmpA/MotB domain protein [Thiorhodococcus drewsii AZ1]|uniref:OmpA/MotB domain protein n=1 Tax=Thiorhodococcus drewsii AZ1 TaxID=765913 RepID=G2E3K4_9GAMM|nr:OmpA family protein [Thiorhodococcus drewsii]EGV30117.1 OmpA/MotB domain protein [Thiorhodococcus drewsii AZ1]